MQQGRLCHQSVGWGQEHPGASVVAGISDAEPQGICFPWVQADCGAPRLEAELESQQQDTLVEQRPDPPGDTPEAKIPDISRAIAQLSSLVSALEKTIQGLGVDTLKVQTRALPPPVAHGGQASLRHAERVLGGLLPLTLEGIPVRHPVAGWGRVGGGNPGNPL